MTGDGAASTVVTKEGITIEKRFNRKHAEDIAVIFEIQSDRETPVDVQITDPIPEQFPVGFHPDFGGQHWSISEAGVEFNRRFDPGERDKTVYGVGNVPEGEWERLAIEPIVELTAENDDSRNVEPESDEIPAFEMESDEGIGDLELSEGGLAETDTRGSDPDRAEHEPATAEATETGTQSVSPEPEQSPGSFEMGPEPGGDPGASVIVSEPECIIEKAIDRDRFSYPTIEFEIIGTADRPFRLRLEDRIPEEVSTDNIGFHHRYGADHWEQRNHDVFYEREIEPGEEITTLYAIRDFGQASAESFLEEPTVTITQSNQPDEDSQTAAADPTGSPDDTASEASGTLPGQDESADTAATSGVADGSDTGDNDLETLLDLDGSPTDVDSSDRDPRPGRDRDGGSGPASPGQASTPVSTPSTEDSLSVSPDSGSLADLFPESTTPSSPTDPIEERWEWFGGRSRAGAESIREDREAKVDDLDESIQDLETAVVGLIRASTEEDPAFEAIKAEFERFKTAFDDLRETGKPVDDSSTVMASMFEDLEERLSALESRLEDEMRDPETDSAELFVTVSDIAEEVAILKSVLASDVDASHQLRTELEAVETELEQVETLAESAAQRTATMTEELTTVRSSLESNQEVLEDIKSDQRALREALHTVSDRLAALEDRIDGLE